MCLNRSILLIFSLSPPQLLQYFVQVNMRAFLLLNLECRTRSVIETQDYFIWHANLMFVIREYKMALVRTAVCAKLQADPNFQLKIHYHQMIQIKAAHAQVNAEGKKRLADFTVECSDPDFVLIMENLTLKRVLSVLIACNPTATLEFRMDIGVSKNQIGTLALNIA